ncbi:MAG: choice-of-anchor L domain-containing protein [Methanosarcinaceae archaeon]
MRNIFRAAFVFTISLLILCVGTASAELVIDLNYQLVSSIRVGRTAYDYTYQVSIINNGSDVQNVTAAVSSGSLNTTIIDGDVNFGDIPAGSTVAGTDTFTIRQNRSYAFDPNSLTWDIQFELAAQIIPPEGGEIQGEGGIVLIVPAGATSDPIPVTITVLQENDLGATPPPNTTFLGGANIDMGQNELMDNADISMPAPDGVSDGAEVYLAKLVEYAGQTMFKMVDTAIVQNGIIVSQDPAFPGVTGSGSYCFLWAQYVGWVEGQVTNINSGIAIPEAVVTISGGYWLDIADTSGYYSLPAWAGNFVVNAFDDQTGDFGEKQGFMPNDGATVLINVEIGESSGPTQSTLINGNFEDGLTGWVLSGAGDVVDSFGPILPYEGSYMAMISSGSGAVGGSSSALEQSFTVPEGANKLTIHYNFISEEYPEYVGSQYNDVMQVTLHTPDGSSEIAFEEVNSANFQPVSGIPCGSGDCTWGQTGWIEASIDVSQWAGTDDTLTLTVHDVGDTIFDTVVLVDSIQFEVNTPYIDLDNINDVLVVGIPVTLSGTAYDSNGDLIRSSIIGIHDGLGLFSTLIHTNSEGKFEYTTTPMYPGASLVTFFPETGLYQRNTFAFNVVTNLLEMHSNVFITKAISIQNTSNSQLMCTMQWDNNVFETSEVIIPANSTKTLMHLEEEPGIRFPFEPNGFVGGTFNIGAFVAGGDLSVVVNDDLQTTTSVSVGALILLRGSVYWTHDLNNSNNDVGICWSPGTEGGVGPISVGAEAGLCLGSDGISLTADGSLSHGELGFTIQIVEW